MCSTTCSLQKNTKLNKLYLTYRAQNDRLIWRQSMWVERDDFVLSGFIKQLKLCLISCSTQSCSGAAHTTRWKHARPREHLCIAQYAPPTHTTFLLSAGRCSSMDFTKYFKGETEKSYTYIISIPVTDDDDVIQEKECRARECRALSNWEAGTLC